MKIFALAVLVPLVSFAAQPPPLPVLAQWQAVGSGCEGGVNGEGKKPQNPNVSLTISEQIGQKIKFSLDVKNVVLDSENGNPRKSINFARQCGFRIALNVPANKSVKSFVAKSFTGIDKAKGVDLSITQQLKFGSKTVAEKIFKKPKEDVVQNGAETFALVANPDNSPPLQLKKCGVQTLVGMDSTFLALRDDLTKKVDVRFADGQRIDFELELEDCADKPVKK